LRNISKSYSCAAVGTASAFVIDVKKPTHRVERRKHDQLVGLDRRKYDDDLAERITGGVRTWSSERADRSPFVKRRPK
jgi:hypothetical protein